MNICLLWEVFKSSAASHIFNWQWELFIVISWWTWISERTSLQLDMLDWMSVNEGGRSLLRFVTLKAEQDRALENTASALTSNWWQAHCDFFQICLLLPLNSRKPQIFNIHDCHHYFTAWTSSGCCWNLCRKLWLPVQKDATSLFCPTLSYLYVNCHSWLCESPGLNRKFI